MSTIINFPEQTPDLVLNKCLKFIQNSCASTFKVSIDEVITGSMDSVNGEETLTITIIDGENACITCIINCILISIEDGKALFEIYLITEDDFEKMREKTAKKMERLIYHQKLAIAINESNCYNLQSELVDEENVVMALYGEIGCNPYEIAGIKIKEDDDCLFLIGIHERYIPILEDVFGYLTKKWNYNNQQEETGED